jgi:dipeptidyl aminopeptidase/acylaminoacyl peptidase
MMTPESSVASGGHETELQVKIGAIASVAPARTSNALYLITGNSYRGELMKFNAQQGVLQTFLPGLSAEYLSFSKDGQWMTYADSGGGSLWRSRADGSEPLQLAKPPMHVEVSSWSPDGRRIAFMGNQPGKPFRIYLVDRDGGPIQEAAEGNDNQGGPSWSPDGNRLWQRLLRKNARLLGPTPGSGHPQDGDRAWIERSSHGALVTRWKVHRSTPVSDAGTNALRCQPATLENTRWFYRR